MIWVSIFAIVVLLLSLFGGLKDGAVKSFFSLIALIIAIPLTGVSYHLLANALSFLPGENWENFAGFFITLAVISVILHFIFFLPRKLIQKIWNKGGFFRLIGGAFNIFNSAIGLTVFTLVISAYPIWGWLELAVADSSVLNWLTVHLSFVKILLPAVFRGAVPIV